MEDWTSAPPFSGTELKLVESVKEYLEDERVLAVVRGQTFVSPVVLPLIGPLLLIFLVRPRSVIVTDQSLITVEESIFLQSKVTRLVSRYRSGAVPVRLSRLGLKIGTDRKVFAMLGSFPAMRRAATLGSSAGA
jgi:hypothetical protein